MTLTIANSDVPLDIYVKKDWQSDPNTFFYDLRLTSVKEMIQLKSEHLPYLLSNDEGFTVSIYVDGINTKQN